MKIGSTGINQFQEFRVQKIKLLMLTVKMNIATTALQIRDAGINKQMHSLQSVIILSS